MVDKESKSIQNLVEESIAPPFTEKKKLATVTKTDKLQASNKTVDAPKSNKLTQLNN